MPPTTYGGIERIVASLVRGLRQFGVEVGLIAHPESTCDVDAKWGWPGSRSQPFLDTVFNSETLRRAVCEFRPEVLHSFSRLAYMLPLMRGRVPLIMSYQREPSPRTVRLAACLSRRDLLTFTGCSDYIARAGRAITGNWEAIHNFVDPEMFRFQPYVSREAPLVFLSRVESIKGAHWAIEIARRSGRRLIIAGNHATQGPEAIYWRDVIEPQTHLSGISYVGPVNEQQKSDLLGQALAMVVPVQWEEPFGIVFAEALACGTPVISCPRGALPEIVRHKVDGFLVRSIDEGCDAVRRAAEISREGCRKRMELEFSMPVIVSRYLDLYRSRTVATQ